MQVNRLRNSSDFACDECEISVDLVEVNIYSDEVFHLCQTHAKELARRLVQAFSLSSAAGNYHEQGSEKVNAPLTEDNIIARTEEHRELGTNERRDGYDG